MKSLKIANTFYHEWISPPRDSEELRRVSDIYNRMGFAGCIGSVDCLHVKLE